MRFDRPQDKSDHAWEQGAVVCEHTDPDDCHDQAIGSDTVTGLAGCDWHASLPDRQAMMDRKPAELVVEGDWAIVDNLDSRVTDSHPFDDRWRIELDDGRSMIVHPDRPVAVWKPELLTRGAPGPANTWAARTTVVLDAARRMPDLFMPPTRLSPATRRAIQRGLSRWAANTPDTDPQES